VLAHARNRVLPHALQGVWPAARQQRPGAPPPTKAGAAADELGLGLGGGGGVLDGDGEEGWCRGASASASEASDADPDGAAAGAAGRFGAMRVAAGGGAGPGSAAAAAAPLRLPPFFSRCCESRCSSLPAVGRATLVLVGSYLYQGVYGAQCNWLGRRSYRAFQ